MLSASHVQCTRIDSSLIFTCDMQKGLVFLKTQNELVIQILWWPIFIPIQQDSCPLNVQKNQTVENNKSRGKRLNVHSKHFTFPWLRSKTLIFPHKKLKFSDNSLTLNNFFCPDLFLTCGNVQWSGNLSFRSAKRSKRANTCTSWLWKSRENLLVWWFIHI